MHEKVEENRKWLQRRAIQGAPYEVCGFIMKDGRIIEIANVSQDPINNFKMCRKQLIEKVPNPEDILAIWHSHPNGCTDPSKIDRKAVKDGYVQDNWIYLIVTPHGVYEHDIRISTNAG